MLNWEWESRVDKPEEGSFVAEENAYRFEIRRVMPRVIHWTVFPIGDYNGHKLHEGDANSWDQAKRHAERWYKRAPKKMQCQKCKGSGRQPDDHNDVTTCDACNGNRYL